MSRVRKNPAYRLHKARNCAVVTINGKNHYLGEYQSAASYEKYARLIAEYESATIPASAPTSTLAAATQPETSINDMMFAYIAFAKRYYTKDGHPTREVVNMIGAMRPLHEL